MHLQYSDKLFHLYISDLSECFHQCVHFPKKINDDNFCPCRGKALIVTIPTLRLLPADP